MNDTATNSRVVSQNLGYNSGECGYFLVTTTDSAIQVVNTGVDTIDLVQSTISIIQLSN